MEILRRHPDSLMKGEDVKIAIIRVYFNVCYASKTFSEYNVPKFIGCISAILWFSESFKLENNSPVLSCIQTEAVN